MLWRVGAQADPRALLLYNDYGVGEVCPKSDAMAAHLERMLAAGVPVHGVGLQSHLRCAGMPDLSSVFENASRLAALGLGVCISELDLRVRGVPGAARPSAVGRDPPPDGLLLADAAAGAVPPLPPEQALQRRWPISSVAACETTCWRWRWARERGRHVGARPPPEPHTAPAVPAFWALHCGASPTSTRGCTPSSAPTPRCCWTPSSAPSPRCVARAWTRQGGGAGATHWHGASPPPSHARPDRGPCGSTDRPRRLRVAAGARREQAAAGGARSSSRCGSVATGLSETDQVIPDAKGVYPLPARSCAAHSGCRVGARCEACPLHAHALDTGSSHCLPCSFPHGGGGGGGCRPASRVRRGG